MSFLAYIEWDPSPYVFNYPLPLIGRPLAWYGFLFALGFMLGYFIMIHMMKRELSAAGRTDNVSHDAFALTDMLCWFTIGGAVIGARLGHVFFYGWDYYRHHLSEIPKIWEGGLASHGGTIGIMVALYLFSRLARKRLPTLGFLTTLDLVAFPTALVAFLIRLGNFINQEIVGTVTDKPWGVLFGHPWEGGPALPRHPVQLYEGFFYLALFFVLGWVWHKGWHRQRPGIIAGIFFVAVFTWRILMEFFKASQGGIFNDSTLETGQVLSIPFVLLGLWLVLRHGCCSPNTRFQS